MLALKPSQDNFGNIKIGPMPPKRGANRRDGVARPSDASRDYLAAAARAEAANPNLPSIPTRKSHAYGSSTVDNFPRQIQAHSGMGVTDMAERIETGVRVAKDREEAEQEGSETRTRRDLRATRRSASASANTSPVPRGRRREPTPDQEQLLGGLREATASRNGGGDGSQSGKSGQSTATPTPPTMHPISAMISSPPPVPPQFEALPPNEPVYPSPLLRFRTLTHPGTPLGSDDGDVDNESVTLERDTYEGDLQRTRPARYREEPEGKNLTAPPKRFSGRTVTHETIQEEEEPPSELSIQKAPTPQKPAPAPTPAHRPRNTSQPRHRSPSEPRRVPQPEPEPVLEPEPQPEPEPEPELHTAPTRTILPRSPIRGAQSFMRESRSFLREPSFHEPTSPLSESIGSAVKSGIQLIPKTPVSIRQSKRFPIVAILILATLSIFTVYSFSDTLADISRGISSSLPLRRQSPYIPVNATGMEAINSLSKHVARIDSRVSELSYDLDSVRADVDNIPAPTTVIEQQPGQTAAPKPKVNFLSVGMGAIINPRSTSPTFGSPGNFLSRPFRRAWDFVSGPLGLPKTQPPLAALAPWEDVGDCWCSVRYGSGPWQLSVKLGRPIVPEEVAVEHIPKGASIDSGVAPREMELWAHFVTVPDTVTDGDDNDGDDSSQTDSSSSSWWSSSKKHAPKQKTLIRSDQFSLHETVMNVLRIAYRGEPESSFSDDRLAGSGFYRIGRWTYDIHGQNHVQESMLDAIIDGPGIRVDHVVVRVKSNWGANETCLYRVRLHGHV